MKDSNQNKQDCEQFLQAFEKPTQIYRCLRGRHFLSPLFLQRNLSYLRGRPSKRKITKREKKSFDWRAFLKHLKPVKNNDHIDSLVLKFLGYFDENVTDVEQAQIDIHLLSHSKHQPKILLKSIPVEINPSIIINPMPFTFSKEQLMHYTSKNDQSCELLIEVTYPEHQNRNNNINTNNNNTRERSSQRSKKRKKVSHDGKLSVFNKRGHRNILEGEYEMNLDASSESSVRKVDRLAWATDIPKVLAGDKRYYQNRSLKFFLQWTNDDSTKSKSTSPTHNENHAPLTTETTETSETTDWGDVRTGSTTSLSTSSGILSDMSCDDAEITALTLKKLPNTLPNVLSNRSPIVELLNISSHIIYRFIYNDDLSMKTETCDEFYCPWCYLNCRSLHPLLMHLRLCHDRFKFSYTPKEDGIQVDVSINERYNCALSPLKHKSHQSHESKEQRPYKRKPYTKVLVSRQRAKKRKSCLTFEELDEAIASDIDSSDAEENKFTVGRGELCFDGHSRSYYRTTNNMLYTHRSDFDEDSEGEMDPGWLQVHTKKLLEDFSDVNEGEKEMLKMWNLHVMKHNFVGYSQMSMACEMFVNEHGDELLTKNLYRNFLLHLTNLHDYDMLSPNQMYTIVESLQAKQHNEQRQISHKMEL